MSNPKKAIAALIPAPITTATGQVVRPLSLGVYALLERIDSPMLLPADAPPGDMLDLIPSLYILTHDAYEVYQTIGDIDRLAMEWATTLPASVIEEIESAASRQISAMLDVISDEGSNKKKADTTAGSSPSCNGQPRHTAGTLSTSCGKCRQAQSS